MSIYILMPHSESNVGFQKEDVNIQAIFRLFNFSYFQITNKIPLHVQVKLHLKQLEIYLVLHIVSQESAFCTASIFKSYEDLLENFISSVFKHTCKKTRG